MAPTGDEPCRRVALELPAVAASAGAARGALAGLLQRGTDADARDTAALLLTELVTNAARHVGGTMRLEVDVAQDTVRVAVHDASPYLPGPATLPAWDSESGRGLFLIETLSDRWGADVLPGSYTVTLLPDPSKEATSAAEMEGCSGLNPAAIDRHAFTVPAAGTLTVKLVSPNPAGSTPAGFDWDLYTYDAEGLRSASDGATGTEETVDSFKKKTQVTFEVCNLDGEPGATISYTFTYK